MILTNRIPITEQRKSINEWLVPKEHRVSESKWTLSRNDDLAGCTGCNWRSGLHGQFLKLSQRGRLTMSLQGSHLGAVVPGWKMRALGSFSGPLLGRVAAGF